MLEFRRKGLLGNSVAYADPAVDVQFFFSSEFLKTSSMFSKFRGIS